MTTSMNGSSSTLNQQAVLHLESMYLDYKTRVETLNRRAHLTPSEQRLVIELKKRKLAVKDALSVLRPTRDLQLSHSDA